MSLPIGNRATNQVTTIGYWVDSPCLGSLRDVALPALSDQDVSLSALRSGVSVGTERLVGRGHVSVKSAESMSCRGMQGSFALPVLYGYSFVGVANTGPECGRRAFVMRPHQRKVIAARAELHWLPDEVSSARATLFPNMETARNAVWDAGLCGEEAIAIIGAGAIGLLVAFVLSKEHGGPVVVVECDAERRRMAQALPWIDLVVAPSELDLGSFAVAFHTSATSAGLQSSIDAVGFEGHVLELSWYGDRSVTIQLGLDFHSQRKRISASQVGTVARSQRALGYPARSMAVMKLLEDSQLGALLGNEIAFADLPETFASIYAGQSYAPCPVVNYE